MDKTQQNYTTQTHRDWMRWCEDKDKTQIRKEEHLILRDAIIKNSRIANLFFMKKMKPLAHELQNMVFGRFHICINADDIAAMVLYLFYQYGKWTRLKTFDAKCTIFCWIAQIAKQRIFSEIIANGFVKPTTLSTMTTSLTIKSMRYVDERCAVINLVDDKQCRMLLSLLYVRKLNDEVCMQMMKLNDEQYKKLRSKASRLLKAKLIEKGSMLWRREIVDENGNRKYVVVNLVSLALSDKTGQVPTVSNDEDGECKYDKDDDNFSFYDLLDGMLPNQTNEQPLENQWTNFVERTAYSTPMGALQLQVWLRAYMRHQPYAKIAKCLGISVQNAYNHFKNANKKVEKQIVCWYRHAM